LPFALVDHKASCFIKAVEQQHLSSIGHGWINRKPFEAVNWESTDRGNLPTILLEAICLTICLVGRFPGITRVLASRGRQIPSPGRQIPTRTRRLQRVIHGNLPTAGAGSGPAGPRSGPGGSQWESTDRDFSLIDSHRATDTGRGHFSHGRGLCLRASRGSPGPHYFLDSGDFSGTVDGSS
jgi:hypothetical protein